MAIIDSQLHCYAANTPERPWVPRNRAHGRPTFTGDELVACMDAVGVDGAILVSPRGYYGFDPGYVEAVQRAHPDRFAIVKLMDKSDPGAVESMADWKRRPGAVGVRLMFDLTDPEGAGSPVVNAVAREAARQDLAVNLWCWERLEDGAALIDAHPQTRFVLDHLGITQPRSKPAPADVWRDLPKVLELARRPNVAIKITAACTMSRQPYPFDDLWEPLGRIFEAYGLERCLWGSDWTRTFELFPYIDAVEPFRSHVKLSSGERALLMGGACEKAYGWTPRRG